MPLTLDEAEENLGSGLTHCSAGLLIWYCSCILAGDSELDSTMQTELPDRLQSTKPLTSQQSLGIVHALIDHCTPKTCKRLEGTTSPRQPPAFTTPREISAEAQVRDASGC